MTRCPSCAGYKVGEDCETCSRRRRYGLLFDGATSWWSLMDLYDVPGDHYLNHLAALDALAEIMIDRHRMIRAHRKELNAEIQDGQRGARDAYEDGLSRGAES